MWGGEFPKKLKPPPSTPSKMVMTAMVETIKNQQNPRIQNTI